MDERAVNSMLNAGKQSNKTMESKRPSSKDMPRDIVSYINSNGINAIVKKSLNRVLRDKPADPLATIAGLLIESATKSYPVFDRFVAKGAYLMDSPSYETVQIDVYLTFQGRSEIKHSHYFTYDEAQSEQFPWDKPEEKSGLSSAIKFINEDINAKLGGVIMHTSVLADNMLCDLLQALEGGEEESKQKNIIKACSEALTYGVAKSFSPVNVYEGFVQSFYPRDEDVEGTKNTKLLISVLNGGKAVASAVKFSKVYLIVDSASSEEPYKILGYY